MLRHPNTFIILLQSQIAQERPNSETHITSWMEILVRFVWVVIYWLLFRTHCHCSFAFPSACAFIIELVKTLQKINVRNIDAICRETAYRKTSKQYFFHYNLQEKTCSDEKIQMKSVISVFHSFDDNKIQCFFLIIGWHWNDRSEMTFFNLSFPGSNFSKKKFPKNFLMNNDC